ncbi:MAG: cytochrome C [Deltaproteobacteria bacterium]|nr:cytochrome C [Deltaproteobacteria bacterium]
MNEHPRLFSILLSARAALLAGTVALTVPALAGAVPAGSQDCLDCHADLEGEEVEFADGSVIDVGVDQEKIDASVHATLACPDCHRAISDHPHPELTAGSRRTYQIDSAKTCNRCHHAYYTRALDGIHYQLLEQGNTDAPTCIDCHGAHEVKKPGNHRATLGRGCARCHEEVFSRYEKSVHGPALAAEANGDLPACTDCHGAHAIADPRKKEFRVAEHEICVKCHGDAKRMKPYGLDANVASTYLEDFHGASNQLYAAGAGLPGKPMATCTDCHGIHSIQKWDREGAPDEIRARIAKQCRTCHEEVPDSFADAWMRHYPPTFESAPLVWAVKWFYRLLIPFIILGLVLHILMHLWKARSISNHGGRN